MVTGAGGSIGSELCRQIARFGPRQLVLFELSEFALYTIEQEFRERFPDLDARVRDRRRARTRARGAGHARRTGRPSCSTPPRTSTCR